MNIGRLQISWSKKRAMDLFVQRNAKPPAHDTDMERYYLKYYASEIAEIQEELRNESKTLKA